MTFFFWSILCRSSIASGEVIIIYLPTSKLPLNNLFPALVNIGNREFSQTNSYAMDS